MFRFHLFTFCVSFSEKKKKTLSRQKLTAFVLFSAVFSFYSSEGIVP